MSSNPVFNRIDREVEKGYAGFNPPASNPQGGQWTSQSPIQGSQWSQPGAAAGSAAANDAMTSDRLEQMYQAPTAGPVQTGRVTVDDVMMKTGMLFGLVIALGVVGWMVASTSPGGGSLLMLGGIAGTLVLGLMIAFKKTISVPLIVGYAALEGLMVGSISQFYNAAWSGIVVQAVLATAATFAGMLLAYRTGLIKVTDKFRRIVTMAIFGYVIFAVINLIYALISGNGWGFGGSGALGIGISLFAVGLAAVSLALDFDSIDRAVAAGVPERYSWLLAHGLIVTIVWLYLEMLRLLARLRD